MHKSVSFNYCIRFVSCSFCSLSLHFACVKRYFFFVVQRFFFVILEFFLSILHYRSFSLSLLKHSLLWNFFLFLIFLSWNIYFAINYFLGILFAHNFSLLKLFEPHQSPSTVKDTPSLTNSFNTPKFSPCTTTHKIHT